MAGGEDKDSKTEEPTEKKLRETIEKGQLPQSREAPILASFVAILVFAIYFASSSAMELGGFLSTFLEKSDAWRLASAQDVINLARLVVVEIVKPVAALFILLLAAGIGASVFQNLPQFVGERIRPQFSRISISKGWSRMFGMQGWVEFAKSLGKLGFVCIVLSFTLSDSLHVFLAGMITQTTAFVAVIRSTAVDILVSIVFVMGLIGAIDIIWSRFHWFQEQRMTKQEVKDELKQSEGDPIIKSRLRSLARDRARKRMMTAVPKATLVIANPTHFAIALRYVRDKDAAPMVLAKGQDLVALKIREIAEANGIPVFEDVALARSMYKQVSVDSVIPSQFYQAVAELVRIVYAKKPSTKAH